jgi:hypothetical protein
LFFDLVFQWSVFLIVRPVEQPAVVLCPLALTIMLLCLPGGLVPQELARRRLYSMYPSYVRYTADTPTLFPLPLARHALRTCTPRCADVLCVEMQPFDGDI